MLPRPPSSVRSTDATGFAPGAGARSLSLVVPALNEAANVEAVVAAIEAAASGRFGRIQIILVNDGSSDGTGQIMDRLAGTIPYCHAVHNARPLGFGGAFKAGLAIADGDHVMLVPGDNDFPPPSLATVFDRIGTADVIVPYVTNDSIRPSSRRMLSRAYTRLLNFLFRLHVPYFNGITVYPTERLKSISIASDGFGFAAEALIKVLRVGASFAAVGIEINERRFGKSKAMRPKEFGHVVRTLALLLREVYLRPAAKGGRPPADRHDAQ